MTSCRRQRQQQQQSRRSAAAYSMGRVGLLGLGLLLLGAAGVGVVEAFRYKVRAAAVLVRWDGWGFVKG